MSELEMPEGYHEQTDLGERCNGGSWALEPDVMVSIILRELVQISPFPRIACALVNPINLI